MGDVCIPTRSILRGDSAVSVRRSQLPDPSNKGDGIHLVICGHHRPYCRGCHAPTNRFSQTLIALAASLSRE